MLSAYRDLHDPVNRQKEMDGAEPGYFGDLPNFTLENGDVHVPGLGSAAVVPQRYAHILL